MIRSRSGPIVNEVLNFWKYAERDTFSTLYDGAPIMMHSIDGTGVLLRVSRFWANALGYTVEEMVGHKSIDFLTPESRKFAEDEVLPRFFREGRVHNVDYQFVRKDGSVMDVLLSAAAQNDSDGKFIRSLAVMFDNSENRRNLAMLQQKQRAESIGRLISGVAHDFNNSLSIIQGNLELMHDQPLDPEVELSLMDALRATRRAATMTRQLITIERKSEVHPQTLDLNTVVRRSATILARLMPETIDVETITTSGLWPTRLDRNQLDTALLNLANNAKQSMPEGGTLTLETTNILLKEEHKEEGEQPLEPGRYVMLSVSDTGVGIPRELHEKVFEPYFSHRPEDQGAGMGLAMVHGFMAQTGGAVRLLSEEGFGTTFKLYFPAIGTVAAKDNFREGMDDDPFEAQDMPYVLVVEDEDELRKILVAQLKAQGLNVGQAANGDFALALLESGSRPQVMITDVVMPGRFQGPALAARALELVPDMKVIFLSGYTREDWETEDVADLRLTKPVSRRELVSAVKSLL